MTVDDSLAHAVPGVVPDASEPDWPAPIGGSTFFVSA